MQCKEPEKTSKISVIISLENLFLYNNSGNIKEWATKETLLASGQGRMNKGRILKTSQQTTTKTHKGQIWNREKVLSWSRNLSKRKGNHPKNKPGRQSNDELEKK